MIGGIVVKIAPILNNIEIYSKSVSYNSKKVSETFRSGIIVRGELRKKISTELRNSISNSTLNITNILFWSQRIGILDADINYNSIKVIKNLALTTTQLQSIKTMRQNILGDLAYPENPFLFATKIN